MLGIQRREFDFLPTPSNARVRRSFLLQGYDFEWSDRGSNRRLSFHWFGQKDGSFSAFKQIETTQL